MHHPPEQSKLACLACKARKTGCDRAKPSCDGCKVRQVSCVYPDRRERRKTKVSIVRPRQLVSDLSLSSFFEQLEHIEERCSQLANALIHTDGQKNSATRSIGGHDTFSSATTQPPLAQHKPSSTRATSENDLAAEVPTVGLLKEAFDQVIGTKQRNLRQKAAYLDNSIPPDLSRTCVENFCKYYEIDTFPEFINMKLMRLIPDIIDMPQVSLDPASLALYYSVLYHGSLIVSTDLAPQVITLTERIYLCCLRAIPAWERQAAGTKTDIITAILMMRAGFQQCDYEFSWNMYKVVYKSVHTLKLHQIDQNPASTFNNPELLLHGADHHRRGLWVLVLVDLFFRLLHDKPAVMTANLVEWRVNLPWLNQAPDISEQFVPTLTFLAKSKLTFLLLQFFERSSQGGDGASSADNHVEQLCTEVEELLEEWHVIDSLGQYEENDSNWWMLYDLALTAYCSIMIIMHKVAGFGLRRVKLARCVLNLVYLSLSKYPGAETASNVFGAFRCYIAYAYLAEYLLSNDAREPGPSITTDVTLLDKVAHCMSVIAKLDGDFAPLLRALQDLNSKVHAKWDRESTGYTA